MEAIMSLGKNPGIVSWVEVSEGQIDDVPDWLAGYQLGVATPHAPDHGPEGGCKHPMTNSSWVEKIALVILETGQFGIYCRFHKGGEIIYAGWKNFEDCVGIYNQWKHHFSKGKYIHNMLWEQNYYDM
jgi:hypothetical protein